MPSSSSACSDTRSTRVLRTTGGPAGWLARRGLLAFIASRWQAVLPGGAPPRRWTVASWSCSRVRAASSAPGARLTPAIPPAPDAGRCSSERPSGIALRPTARTPGSRTSPSPAPATSRFRCPPVSGAAGEGGRQPGGPSVAQFIRLHILSAIRVLSAPRCPFQPDWKPDTVYSAEFMAVLSLGSLALLLMAAGLCWCLRRSGERRARPHAVALQCKARRPPVLMTGLSRRSPHGAPALLPAPPLAAACSPALVLPTQLCSQRVAAAGLSGGRVTGLCPGGAPGVGPLRAGVQGAQQGHRRGVRPWGGRRHAALQPSVWCHALTRMAMPEMPPRRLSSPYPRSTWLPPDQPTLPAHPCRSRWRSR